MKSSKFTRKNIKHGKTLYEVMAYPLTRTATVQPIHVTSRLKEMSISGNDRTYVYFECLSNGTDALVRMTGLKGDLPSVQTPDTRATALRMVNDRHLLGATSRNHHRLFTSQHKATAYAEMVRAGRPVGSMFGRKSSPVEKDATH